MGNEMDYGLFGMKMERRNLKKLNKDGIQDGLQTSWYENGQKKFELTYKDGKEYVKNI